jgi:protein PhnA
MPKAHCALSAAEQISTIEPGISQGWQGHNAVHTDCNTKEHSMTTRDSNGTPLSEGDSVTLIKDLKVKGTSLTLKRGTMVRGIHLTDDPAEIECRVEKIKGLVLRTEFVKKA